MISLNDKIYGNISSDRKLPAGLAWTHAFELCLNCIDRDTGYMATLYQLNRLCNGFLATLVEPLGVFGVLRFGCNDICITVAAPQGCPISPH